MSEARREAGREEFEAMFLEHADAVLAYARRRTDPDTAQEIVAEAFTVAWRRLDDVPEPALPWLLGVARRSLANARRASSRQQALALRLVHEPAGATEDAMTEVDAQVSARAALARLSPAEREAIELLAWEGLTPAEAATVLGCSRGAFAVRVHRARRHLRRNASEVVEPTEAAHADPPDFFDPPIPVDSPVPVDPSIPADPPRPQEAT